jgi:hypothetical protein
MAFAVICKSCQARFLLNDDLLRRKVAGRVVTVRCRQCHAPIEVDASELDPQQVAPANKPEPPGPPPPPPLKAALTYKPAPAPPRPAKSSTLMGIGSPPRPGAAPQMIALSPGLLNMSAPSPTAAMPAPTGPRGFPEPPPPPPPESVEETISGDWEIPDIKTPAFAPVEAAPESVDDFIEELPPSLPPPVEEAQPVSAGTPSLQALTHHEPAVRPATEDFFSNMNAALNGGTTPLAVGAPTIDVSRLAASSEPQSGLDIDLASLDVPRTGKQTLPLFGLEGTAPVLQPPPVDRPVATNFPTPRDGSLSPAALDRPAASERPDSARTRRNVIAPATKSVPPPAPGQRRSGLAVPVVLVLAAAAAFLIWKRSHVVPPDSAAHAEQPIPLEPKPPAAAQPPAPAAAAEPVAIATTSAAPLAEDDVTFETAPNKPTPKTAAPAEAKGTPPSSTKAVEEPSTKPKAETPSEPSAPAPAPKEEPKPAPATPGEPAGPFDRAAAAAALTSAAGAASNCRKEGDPSGTASVVITFAPSGRVTSANIGGPPFAGTPTGGCIAAALRKARVPPFEGERVTVSKTIVIQ